MNRFYRSKKASPFEFFKSYLPSKTSKIKNKKDKLLHQKLDFAQFSLDHSAISIFWIDLESSRILYANKKACDSLGFSLDDITKLDVSDVDPNFTKNKWGLHALELEKTLHQVIFSNHKRKDGSIFPVEIHANIMKFDGRLYNLAFALDISDKKIAIEQIDFFNTHDFLTGLHNRIYLDKKMDQFIEDCETTNTKLAVCFVDLDNFKYINDVFGHSIGDQVLQQSASRLSKIIQKKDLIVRFGSDEFVVVFTQIKNSTDIIDDLNKILKSFETKFETTTGKYSLSSSIGVSIYPDDAIHKETLVKYADTAMYYAKKGGRNQISFFTERLLQAMEEKLLIKTMLKEGLEQNQFTVCYQPQVQLSDMKLVGFEALVRWNHPEMGYISPSRFIDVAENSKLIIPLGKWVLKQACNDISEWIHCGIFDGTIAVNTSGVELEYNDFVDDVFEILTDSKLNSRHLEIEVTESSLMHNPTRWLEILRKLADLGISLAIDDFGTGYSSLSYLRQMPVNTLKIDQSFIEELPNDADSCIVAETIVGLAKNMRMKSLAEGIETVEQCLFLRQVGCHVGQGYFFGKPLNKEDAKQFILQWDQLRKKLLDEF